MVYGILMPVLSAWFITRSLLYLVTGKRILGLIGWMNVVLLRLFQSKEISMEYQKSMLTDKNQSYLAICLLLIGIFAFIISIFILIEELH